MAVHTLDEELMLRIGLAARALPDTDVKRLLAVLEAALGGAVTLNGLSALDIPKLSAACDRELAEVPRADLERALSLLQDDWRNAVDSSVPEPEEGPQLAHSLRVAIGSNRGEWADGHFGSCARFLVYEVSSDRARLADVRSAIAPNGTEEKSAWRAQLLSDCQLLFIASIGGPPAAQVTKRGIHPIKCNAGDNASQIVARVQQMISGNPPPWLRKHLEGETRVA